LPPTLTIDGLVGPERVNTGEPRSPVTDETAGLVEFGSPRWSFICLPACSSFRRNHVLSIFVIKAIEMILVCNCNVVSHSFLGTLKSFNTFMLGDVLLQFGTIVLLSLNVGKSKSSCGGVRWVLVDVFTTKYCFII